MEDYWIRGVTILDVMQREEKSCDLLIRNEMIDKIVQEPLPGCEAAEINGRGLCLTHGWLDAHAHLYQGENTIGVDGNLMLKDGVTMAVDAGTAGPWNFEDFRSNTMQKAEICERAYLNLAPMGLDKRFGELSDLATVSVSDCQRVIETYPEEILGLKLRIDPRVCKNPEGALRLAKTVKQKTGKPFVVHPSRCQLPVETVLSYMDEGDIYAHTFADKTPGILDEKGRIKKAVLEARKRGVQFDLSHGSGNFSFEVAQKALAQGFMLDAISTDLHKGSLSRVQSLGMVMSKMLACGMELWDVLELVTIKAAQMLGLPKETMEIKTGKPADLALFSIEKGSFRFLDSDGMEKEGEILIRPRGAVLGGKMELNMD